MSPGFRLARVGLLLIAVACGTDYVDLLPVTGAAGSGGGTGGLATAGSSTSGGSPEAGGVSGGGAGGAAGTFTSAGKNSAGCGGFGCGGFGNFSGFGGATDVPTSCERDAWFCPRCKEEAHCAPEDNCNHELFEGVLDGVCLPRCDSVHDCEGGYICDQQEHTCAPCGGFEQCKQYNSLERKVCVDGRCEECRGNQDCTGDRGHLCIGRRCVECGNDGQCPSGECDEASGRCQQ